MPELPEIEVVKLQLQKTLIGQSITRVESLHSKSVRGNTRLVEGKKIIGVKRLGKMLVLELEGDLCIAIHFKMTGQLVLVHSSKIKDHRKKRVVGGHPTTDWVGDLPSKHTRAIFYLSSKKVLYFNDQRIFGWVKILNLKSLKLLKYLKNLGPEPWDMSDKAFGEKITRSRRAIKLVIMDQKIISGVGNIYANDALWEARIHPTKPGNKLNYEEIKRLRKAIVKVLKQGIRYGGATAADDSYINLYGLGGKYQKHFRVYEQEGKKCKRSDGGVIKKTKLGGRGTYYCLACQS